MIRQLTLAATLAGFLGAGSIAHAGAPPSEVKADDAAALRALNEKMMNAWCKGDKDSFKSTLSDQIWSAWDLDMAGKPMAVKTNADLMKLFDEMSAMMKAMGATTEANLTKNDCRVSGDLGVCMVEATMKMSAPQMPPMTMPVRSTEVFQRVKGTWKVVHHHGSMAQASPMPPNFMALNAKSAKMEPVPGMPGMSATILWMDPVTQAMVGLMKVGKGGMKQARHTHNAAVSFYVVSGSVITTDGNGKDTAFGPSSVIYRPAGLFHNTTIKPNTTVFMVTTGSLAAVDEAGKPVPSTDIKGR
jgi:ketosteroid isomerase-like protein